MSGQQHRHHQPLALADVAALAAEFLGHPCRQQAAEGLLVLLAVHDRLV